MADGFALRDKFVLPIPFGSYNICFIETTEIDLTTSINLFKPKRIDGEPISPKCTMSTLDYSLMGPEQDLYGTTFLIIIDNYFADRRAGLFGRYKR